MDPARSFARAPAYVTPQSTAASQTYASASASVGVGSSSFSGRLSLGILGAAVVGLVGFYYVTRHLQKGV